MTNLPPRVRAAMNAGTEDDEDDAMPARPRRQDQQRQDQRPQDQSRQDPRSRQEMKKSTKPPFTLTHFAHIPVVMAAHFDNWIDEMIDACKMLDREKSMVVTICATILLGTSIIVFWFVDAATQSLAYTSMGASVTVALCLTLLINALESYGMVLSSQRVGLMLWFSTTSWNVYWNVQYLPETLSFASAGTAWNLLLSIMVAAAPQFVAVIAIRVIGVTWQRGIEALAEFITLLLMTPRYVWSGIKRGINR